MDMATAMERKRKKKSSQMAAFPDTGLSYTADSPVSPGNPHTEPVHLAPLITDKWSRRGKLHLLIHMELRSEKNENIKENRSYHVICYDDLQHVCIRC